MVEIKLSFTTAHLNRLVSFICSEKDYEHNKLDDETEGAFTKRMIIEQLKDNVKRFELDAHHTTENQYVKGLQDVWEAENTEPEEINII